MEREYGASLVNRYTRGMAEEMTGRCMKCKENRPMKEGWEEVTMKSGMLAAKGNCTVCSTGMYKILGKKK